ncbi:pilus assembly protein PilP [Arhodomonas sp. SL1]|uniref:pilus assembly protein PilP n=1 Tax=Arhodomonas sp. SL1 TaxID=3425691 RepID=UPI003F882F97
MRPSRRPGIPALAPTLLAMLLLGGCGGGDMNDLRHYIQDVKSRPGGDLEPIPQMEALESYAYPEDPLRDPFEPLSFARPEPTEDAAPGTGPSPDPTRPKEPLEAYPLDALQYVGTLSRGGELWALIQAPDDVVHRVQTGNYMGQNHGRIDAIRPMSVTVRELVPDNGGWRERHRELALKD